MAGLATAYGDALLTKLKAQRIADAAAFAGAVAYNQLSTTAAITNAANRVAATNGIATDAMTASLVSSPSGDGNSAVHATVTLSVNVALTQLISHTSSVSVSANSYVELKGSAFPCIIALASSGTGVTMSGGTTLTANACAVSSNSSTAPAVTAPNGTTITTPVVSTPAALTSTQKTNIKAPSGTSSVTYLIKTVADPLANKTAVTTATGHLSSVGLLGNPTLTAPPANANITFDYKTMPPKSFPPNCGGSFNSPTWTVTCTGAGPFNFGGISLNGGITVVFNNTTTATYNFSGSVANTGSALTFNGAGTYNIAGGLYTSGGTTTSFKGAGTYNIGQYNGACDDGRYYSICHDGTTLTFAGPSTFVLTNGLYDRGGETITLGSGSTSNSYQLGASTSSFQGSSANGYSINMGGGSFVTLNDATGAGGLFQAAGSIGNGGGSCLTLPAASAHDINGSISLGGGATLGAGVYTLSGYFAAGAGNGGSVTCNGVSVGVHGSGVTIVIGANTTVTCSGASVAFASSPASPTWCCQRPPLAAQPTS